MADAPMNEVELEKFVGVLRKRQSLVENLLVIANNVCNKLEAGQPISDNQRDVFRAALDAVNTSRFLGS